ncbi:MAG: N-formylglutamate amidohydrolase [Deltaproteobacteria bacterium]|nr:N-formylglutamate amidohydrolase [Deltaproteobacteria bacterium]
MAETAFLISCEHAVNHVPDQWRHLFSGREDILATHRGFDPGALELARYLANTLAAPCFEAEVTRLLTDHNRSPENRGLWSEFSRGLGEREKEKLLDDYYHPFRRRVAEWISGRRQKGLAVVHLSVHSFTPILKEQTRRADIGLLYDPGRRNETAFARLWQKRLKMLAPQLRVRLNYPYRGTSDCHQQTYRRQFDGEAYLALELEVNQALVNEVLQQWEKILGLLAESIPKELKNCSA